MPRALRSTLVLLVVVTGLSGGPGSSEAAAQSRAFEFGIGAAPGVAGGSASALGAVTWPLAGRFGTRVGVAWTRGRALGTAEATVALQDGPSVFEPRLLVGGGWVVGGGEGGAVATGGLGLIGRISWRLDTFVEARGVWGADDDPRAPAALISVGLRYLLARPPR